jgi:hypothetical protein
MEKTCEFCGKHFEVRYASSKKRFCDRSCSNSWQHANGIRRNPLNDKTTWEWWVAKLGAEEAEKRREEWRARVSDVTSGEKNPMFGKSHTSESCARIGIRTKGKTIDEIYGNEKACLIRSKLGCVGDKNPAYGKVYARGGRSKIQGVYKGLRFRSSYEISFLVEMFTKGVEVSAPASIKYLLDGVERTYTPDFQIGNEIIEIKPEAMIRLRENQAKFEAARLACQEAGFTFKVVTERELVLLTLEQIRALDGVEWNKGALDYIDSKNHCN